MKEGPVITLLNISISTDDWAFSFLISAWITSTIGAFIVGYLIWNWWMGRFSFKEFEIDETELGIGNQKLKFKPNYTDQQIAYEIWVELSTRKVGLEIDFDNDVISEVYDSWYEFFSITRELIKVISVSKIRNRSTQKIIHLSIDVLNEGLRPHLTKWQSRFRFWFENELDRVKSGPYEEFVSPQDIQAKFPEYNNLKDDMKQVNMQLITYRKTMRKLVFKE